MNSNLNTIRDNINQLQNRFDQLYNEVISKLNECSDCLKCVKNICDQVTEMVTTLNNKLANVSNEQKEWEDIKVKLATTSIEGMITLNIGGEKFSTKVETLTHEKNTFFTALFSQQWQIKRDPNDGSIFIDRNGKIFIYILEYFRTNTVPNNIMQDETLLNSLFIEAEYFRLHGLMDILTTMFFPHGTLLQPEHKKKLNEFYGIINQKWGLIYKASRDGFDAATFHSYCDNQGPTMTIILSNNNYLFGGYTSIPWTSDDSYKNDPTAFLFTLINPHNIPPTKYGINYSHAEYAVRHHSRYGPTFGDGHDIYLADGCNWKNSSYTGFPRSYFDITGKGEITFTGAYNFIISDIEVFKLL
ncbi:unnamed protein product [Rotaria sordida]|uniref:TLDc domain-containing protein n=1 Tax=Rotaria sordida TaxID=392033 RepID=A0A814BW97_9BILA|nr:unnamed protein product [Rotaria sordida]